ncbi:16742_t:CDS:2, partial [Acaulospora colombiana]
PEVLDVTLNKCAWDSNSSALLFFDKIALLRVLYMNYRLFYGPEPDSAPWIATCLPKMLEFGIASWSRIPNLLEPSSGEQSSYQLRTLLPLTELASTRNMRVARTWEDPEL